MAVAPVARHSGRARWTRPAASGQPGARRADSAARQACGCRPLDYKQRLRQLYFLKGAASDGTRFKSNRADRIRIDFSDIPEASLAQFRKEARRRRVGYKTLINEVLAEHVRKDVA
jgi:hypothetical protein